MGIVNFKKFEHTPTWRDKLDDFNNSKYSSAEKEQAKSDMQKELERNREEMGKIWKESKDAMNERMNALKDSIPSGEEVKSIVHNVKNDIKKEVENSKKMAEDAYNDYRKQYDEGVKQVKEGWKEAKENINKVKSDLKNLDVNKLKQAVSNGFTTFLKENLQETLGLDPNNKETPLVRQIFNKLKDEFGGILDKNFPRPNPYNACPSHRLMVELGGNYLYDKSGCIVTYHEIADYLNNGFNIRILEIEVPIFVFHKIVSSKRKEVNGIKYAYEISLSCLPLTDDVFQQIPINTGKFIAVLQDNDSIMNIIDEVKKGNDNETTKNDQISPQKFKLNFILYKESELKFQDSQLINYVLENPKPLEIIMKAYEDTNKGMKIMMSNLENDVPMGKLIIPHMSFLDIVDYMDKEVGLYNTDYMTYFENDTFYLLNTNNIDKINATNKKYESTIELFIDRHKGGLSTPSFIQKRANKIYTVSCDVGKTEIEVKNRSVYKDSIIYIKPQGNRNYHDMPASRKTNVVRKVTNVNPLQKDNSKALEFLSFELTGFPINTSTPLTKVIITGSDGKIRNYRVCYKEIFIESHNTTTTRIKAFRRLEK